MPAQGMILLKQPGKWQSLLEMGCEQHQENKTDVQQN